MGAYPLAGCGLGFVSGTPVPEACVCFCSAAMFVGFLYVPRHLAMYRDLVRNVVPIHFHTAVSLPRAAGGVCQTSYTAPILATHF